MDTETLVQLAKDGNLVSVVCAALLVGLVRGGQAGAPLRWPRVVLCLGLLGGLIFGVWMGTSSGRAMRVETAELKVDKAELGEANSELGAENKDLQQSSNELSRSNMVLLDKIAQVSQGGPMPTIERLAVSARVRGAEDAGAAPVGVSVRRGAQVLASRDVPLERGARGEAMGRVTVPLESVPLTEARNLEVRESARPAGVSREGAELRVEAQLSDGTRIRLR